ncbi:hypothetical protein DXG03_004098 [Asterophora parasitica]|uniref:Mediator of RNA polymerase II transcription subunit 13 n=1 Tax=Asterophora parasitica TaxID=117018 RepID=A0A9P7G1F9_9AGAR|nr:hypothetical protein DXG03_004098 [Asterophora parasitica]
MAAQAISLSDHVLGSRIALPPDPCVVYTRLSPLPAVNSKPAHHHQAFEFARRSLLSRNKGSSAPIIESILSSVDVAPNSPTIHVFAVSARDAVGDAMLGLSGLHFDGLTTIRLRLLDDIATAATLSSPPRPLLHVDLQIHLSINSNRAPPSLVIHPLPHPTPLIPLPYTLSPLLPQGTPITLLPHGTPAFFLVTYIGSTTALTNQFRETLQGTGVGLWDTSHSPSHSHTSSSTTSTSIPPSSTQFTTSSGPQYIIAWINVSNPHGEDKGLLVVYPASLCAVCIPIPPPEAPERLPQLPGPLVASPVVGAAVPAGESASAGSRAASVAPLPYLGAVSLPSSIATASIPTPVPMQQPQPRLSLQPTSATLPPIPSSPSSDSTRLFSALTLHRTRPMRQTVAEVGGYVDEVARERERERERLREEREKTRVREGGAMVSPKLSRANTGVVITPVVPGSAVPVPEPSQPVPGPSQPQQQQQSFYPSPPQTNPPIPPPIAAAPGAAVVAPVDASSVLTPTPTPQSTQQPTSASTPAASASAAVSNAPAPAQPYDDAASAWSQPYLDMDFAMLDMDMSSINLDMDDMGMSMGFGGSASSGFGASLGIGSSSGDADGDGGAFGEPSAFGGSSGGTGASGGGAARGSGYANIAGSSAGNGSAGFGNAGDLGMGGMGDFDDSAFTDDDFSFFDRPSTTTNVHAPASRGVPSVTQQPMMQGEVVMQASNVLSGPGPPQQRQQATHQIPTPHSHDSVGSPWALTTPQVHPHSNTHSGLHPHPNIDEHGHPTPTPTPNVSSNLASALHGTLLPPTPPSATFSPVPLTPFPHLSPLTPGVRLHPSHAPHSPAGKPGPGGGTFDPIPFAPFHRVLDGKYAVGKFALPSPPEEREEEGEDRWSGKGLGPPYVYVPKPSNGAKTGDGDSAAKPEVGAAGKEIAESNANSADGESGSNGNGGERGWRDKYIAATDPRIGVVKKLIGVKRKMDFHAQGGRRRSWGGGISSGPTSESGAATASVTRTSTGPAKSRGLMSPSWIREHEDWDTNAAAPRGTSEKDEEEEDDSDMDADAPSSPTTPAISRPSTPPPAYLPPGPTLLPTMFDHTALLALSTPLRAPAHLHHMHLGHGVGMGLGASSTQATSVPTPVSPAAILGAATEKSKSLEAAAYIVASEVVENPTWAEAWRASTLVGGVRAPLEVWVGDVRFAGRLLGDAVRAQGLLEVGELFVCLESGKGKGKETSDTESEEPESSQKGLADSQQKHLRVMEAPLISIGKGDAVIRILPTALRFWGKLGLGPRGGKKNGTVFVLFEDGSEHRQEQVEAWLSTVVSTYEAMHLGTLVPGKSPANPRAGVYPVRFDSSFRKSLATLMPNLPCSSSSLIFFIVTPLSTLTLASPVLRQVFSAVRKATKTYSEAQVHFHFIAEQLIHGTHRNSTSIFTDLEMVCGSVYSRILVPVDRLMSRRFFELGERIRRYFQEPVLTLARPIYNKVSFARAPHASLDVVDRGTFLHVGYLVSPCGKWILAACVDQRGEAYELGVWLTQTPVEGDADEVSDEMFLVRKIWDFAVQFAKKANVEWRIVVSRLGALTEAELDGAFMFSLTLLGWKTHINVQDGPLVSMRTAARCA